MSRSTFRKTSQQAYWQAMLCRLCYGQTAANLWIQERQLALEQVN